MKTAGDYLRAFGLVATRIGIWEGVSDPWTEPGLEAIAKVYRELCESAIVKFGKLEHHFYLYCTVSPATGEPENGLYMLGSVPTGADYPEREKDMLSYVVAKACASGRAVSGHFTSRGVGGRDQG